MKHTVKYLFPLLALTLLSACSPRIDYRGKSPEVKDMSTIIPGKSNKFDVLKSIGSPTFESTYGPKTWFYVHKKTATTAFFKPDMVEKNTISVTFNDLDVVEKIDDLDPEMQDITPISHTTPTVGADRTILQQVFSNFGRKAKKSAPK